MTPHKLSLDDVRKKLNENAGESRVTVLITDMTKSTARVILLGRRTKYILIPQVTALRFVKFNIGHVDVKNSTVLNVVCLVGNKLAFVEEHLCYVFLHSVSS